jgi:hypothetical protein
VRRNQSHPTLKINKPHTGEGEEKRQGLRWRSGEGATTRSRRLRKQGKTITQMIETREDTRAEGEGGDVDRLIVI